MTDLLHTIPDFPVKLYTHLIPSLEKHLITTTDLLILDALEIAKRAQLPLLDVRRLANHVLAILQGQLGLKNENAAKFENIGESQADFGTLKQTGEQITTQWSTISTLNVTLDAALGGGIPTGYITEITGERYAPSLHPFSLPPTISTNVSLPYQRRRKDPTPPQPSPISPTSPTQWPLASNPLHFHRIAPSHPAAQPAPAYTPPPLLDNRPIPPQPNLTNCTLIIQHPDPPNP